MKKIIILLLVLFISKLSYSQMTLLNNLEIGEIIFSETDLRSFINNDNIFISCNYDKLKLLELNHSLGIFNFNREVKNHKLNLELFGTSIKEIYGYIKSEDRFCLYVLTNIDKIEKTNIFIEELGWPWNVSKENYQSGNFGMLLWEKNGLNISLMKKSYGYNLFMVTNLPLNDLVNNSPW